MTKQPYTVVVAHHTHRRVAIYEVNALDVAGATREARGIDERNYPPPIWDPATDEWDVGFVVLCGHNLSATMA